MVKSQKKFIVSTVSVLIGVIIVASLVPGHDNAPNTPVDPKSSCSGIYSDDDLINYAKYWGNSSGSSWDDALLIRSVNFTDVFTLAYTSLYVVLENITFQKNMYVFAAAHVQFRNCTFINQLKLHFSFDIIVESSLLAKSYKAINSETLSIKGNTFLNASLSLINTAGAEIFANRMLGSFELTLNHRSHSVKFYLNDLRYCSIYADINGWNNKFSYAGAGNLFTFDVLRASFPDISFNAYTPVSSEALSVVNTYGFSSEGAYVLNMTFEAATGFIDPAPWCYIPNYVPNITLTLSPAIADPNIYSTEPPQVTLDADDPFFIAEVSYFLSDETGHISSLGDYTALPSGRYVFLANATTIFGETIGTSKEIIKDVDAPRIESITPSNGTICGKVEPIISVMITELSGVDRIVYSLQSENEHKIDDANIEDFSNGTYRYSFTLSEWPALPDGMINVTVRVFDRVNLSSSFGITLWKDTESPIITVDLNDDTLYGPNTAHIYFNFTASDPSGISRKELVFNESSYIIETTFNDLLSYISPEHGLNVIIFRAEDKAGNINETERAVEFDFRYDSLSITFTSDSGEDHTPAYFNAPFSFIAQFSDEHPDSARYTIDSGTWHDLILGMNILSRDHFDALLEGNHTLTAMCNDTVGNTRELSLSFVKDTVQPAIEIFTRNASLFRESQGVFTIRGSVTEVNLNTIVYNIDAVNISGPLTLNGSDFEISVNYTDLRSLSDSDSRYEYITVRITATDMAGNVRNVDFIIVLDPVYYLKPDSPLIIGVELMVLFGIAYALNRLRKRWVKIKKNHKSNVEG